MNVLFLTMAVMRGIENKGIYSDLMRRFRNEGHLVFIVRPSERRDREDTALLNVDGIKILRVRTLNVQKTSVIEKGLGQVLLEYQFKSAIKKYVSEVKFDLILYTTPPITLTNVIKWAKLKNPTAKTYLMLKDIFPQNALDLKMLTKGGIKGFLYRSFRKKEKELYRISDYIGCMSPANVQYLIKHNSDIDPRKVEICPNSYEVPPLSLPDEIRRVSIREKFHLPIDRPILIYGGSLGKPQDIPFVIKCLEANKERIDCHFVIIGSGFEYPRLKKWFNEQKPKNVSLFERLPRDEYNLLADACDVGLIFLDYRFTIPNYPSRLLAYLMTKKPIIACTDPNCDTGSIAEENGYGYWCPSNSVDAFTSTVDKMLNSDIRQMGEKGFQFYLNNYTVDHSYYAIIQHF